jgi:uncharacterized membrane protein (DUF485 family)
MVVIAVSVEFLTHPFLEFVRRHPALHWPLVICGVVGAIIYAAGAWMYFYKSWRKLPLVPNKISYGIWMGFESLVFLALLLLIWFYFIHSAG